jgi:hypothetical protein
VNCEPFVVIDGRYIHPDIIDTDTPEGVRLIDGRFINRSSK